MHSTSTSGPCILIVDDNLDNLKVLSSVLESKNYDLRLARSGALALKALNHIKPNLILLDVNMPEMSGYEACERIKHNPETQDIPIIFISALNDVSEKVKAFSKGAMDYIEKPFKANEVVARIELQLSLQALQHKARTLSIELEERVKQRTIQLKQSKHKLAQEIVRRKQAERQLRYMAFHDPLTGLPNRNHLVQALDIILQSSPTNEGKRISCNLTGCELTRRVLAKSELAQVQSYAILYLDCDHFKVVNDSLGHSLGDQLLVAIAQRLSSSIPKQALLTRHAGDEFTILLPLCSDSESQRETVSIQVAQTILDRFAEAFLIQHHELFISVSIGIVLSTPDYQHPTDILRDADTAMYRAKELGRSQYQIFSPLMHQRVLHRLQVESNLRRALERQEFSLVYQPIISLKNQQIVGFETLIRWIHPTEGFISPADFIPIAEDTGLILPIGLWTIQEACRQTKVWQRKFFPELEANTIQNGNAIPWKVSVNLSVKQFSQPNLIACIDTILHDSGLDSQFLKLEITETAIMDNADSAMKILQDLKSRNIQLAIDDFGTGYSSLSYLHRFPVDTLKIDRSFIMDLLPEDDMDPHCSTQRNSHNHKIIQATINLAHDLEMDVVAEGIESSRVMHQLNLLNCDLGQGYFFSRPLPPEELEKLLKAQHGQVSSPLSSVQLG